VPLDADAARECVLDHADVLDAVAASADAVAGDWPGARTRDASAVADPLAAELRERGVLAALPELLAAAVDAAGGALQADPVPAPPYVAVTSRGPVLRATLDEGRLVVTLAVFRVTDTGGYERVDGVEVAAEIR
jgi:hypothetical protein